MKRVDGGITLNPGLLRHQVQWQRKNVTGQDSYGQDVFTWQAFSDCKCQVKELSGRELEFAMQRWAEAKYEVKQHYVPGLKERFRGSWYLDGEVRYLDILGVLDPVGTGLYQCVYAKEWVE